MNEEKIWFNQQLFYFRDKIYTVNGCLEISINSSTIDYQTFSTIGLNLTISNDQIRKTQSLNYYNTIDLINSLEEIRKVEKNLFESKTNVNDITKKYSNKTFRLSFKISKTDEKICIISIVDNETDFTRVVIPYELVITILEILKSFRNDFININSNFINRCINTEVLNQIKNTRDSIKALPSFFGSLNTNNTNVKNILLEEAKEIDTSVVEENINDLDKFLGEDMSNIKIPEIDSPKKTSEDKNPIVVSDFINNFLKNDLFNLENVLMSSALNDNPFLSIVNNIEGSLQLNDSLIPEISQNDLKSISYMSKKIYLEILKKCTEYNEKVPSSIFVIKYNIIDPEKVKEINKNLALDLLVILSYFKNLKEKLELREPDLVKNKNLLYLNFRLFMDPLIFTFLNLIDVNVIKPLVRDKYSKYSKIGLFNTYSNLLSTYNLDDVSENKIIEFIDMLVDKVVSQSKTIDVVHKNFYDSKMLKLPYENDLTLEQIINEFIPKELFYIFRKDNSISLEQAFIEKFGKDQELTDKYFLSKVLGEQEISKKLDKKSNIERLSQFFTNEVPEKYKEEFTSYIKSLKKENFIPEQLSFNLIELGDNILKIIYIWNNSEKTETYTDFSTKVESCILDKNTILSSFTSKKDDEVVNNEWDLSLLN